MAFFSGLRRLFDPDRLAMAQALSAGDDGSAATMAERFRQLQADRERLRNWVKRPSRFDLPEGVTVPYAESAGLAGGDFERAGSGAFPDAIAANVESPIGRSIANRAAFAQGHAPPRMGGDHGHVSAGLEARGSSEPRGFVGDYLGGVSGNMLDIGQSVRTKGLNGWGYFPQATDPNTLARIMYSESHEIPEDDEAIGWATINRVGRPGYQSTLDGVLHARNQYEIVAEGNPQHQDRRLWTESGHPEALTGWKKQRWLHALKAAERVLSGTVPDITGGATGFFASRRFDPNHPMTAPGPDFGQAIASGRLRQSKYRSAATGPNRQYFWIENAPSPPKR